MYCLVQDDDGHWFVIPAEKQDEFEEYMRKIYDLGEYPEEPEWLDGVGGAPSRVIFENYTIK